MQFSHMLIESLATSGIQKWSGIGLSFITRANNMWTYSYLEEVSFNKDIWYVRIREKWMMYNGSFSN